MKSKALQLINIMNYHLSCEDIKEIRVKKQKSGEVVCIVFLELRSEGLEEAWIIDSKNFAIRKEYIVL